MSEAVLGLIGGTGFNTDLVDEVSEQRAIQTPYGDPSQPLIIGTLAGLKVAVLNRHGPRRTIPPHRVNYRANLWAMRSLGIREIVAVNAVGGITPSFRPGLLCLPDQLVDYTWGREHTFHDGSHDELVFAEFASPFFAPLREELSAAALAAGVDILHRACYGVTQGPRLETEAEIRRLKHDGCDIVGMTGMPEAGLAAELELGFASVGVVANWAAGIADTQITIAAIQRVLHEAMGLTYGVLRAFARARAEAAS